MITPDLLVDVAYRFSWTVHDIVRLMDFNYSLFRMGVIDTETMNIISMWLWTLI